MVIGDFKHEEIYLDTKTGRPCKFMGYLWQYEGVLLQDLENDIIWCQTELEDIRPISTVTKTILEI